MATSQDFVNWICGQELEPAFLQYLFVAEGDALLRFASGSVHQTIYFPEAKAFHVCVPARAEQQRIVAILDEAFDSIATAKANAEKNLQNARELFESYLGSLFTACDASWRSATIDQHVRFIDYRGRTPEKTREGVRLITAKNVKKGFIQDEPMEFVAQHSYAEWMTRGIPKEGDVLFTTEAPLGNIAQLDTQDRVVFAQRVIIMQADSKYLDNTFLKYLLLSAPVQALIHRQATGATAQGIKASLLKRIEISFPESLSEQGSIVATLDALREEVDRLEAICGTKLAALDELKKSLLQQAFSGQLTNARPIGVSRQSALQTTTPEFAAHVISFAYARHERQKREKTFGRVKEQKLLHLVESIAGIDLGRHPVKDAAGPNDFQHMLNAESWAKGSNVFEMVERGEGYDFRKLDSFANGLSTALEALKPYQQQLERVIDLLVPMTSREAEVFVTVHAAWNNLLLDGVDATDNAIVFEARENWHADKLKIPESSFRSAIALIREKGVVPDGTAKYVGGQTSLL